MRRMQRMQRVVQVLGSVMAVAVVFAGVALFGSHRATGVGGGGGGGGELYQAGSNSPTGDPTTPTGTPTSPATPTSTPQISEDELAAALKTVLNGTGVTGSSYAARGSDYVPTIPLGSTSPIMVDAQISAHHDIGFLELIVSGPQDTINRPGTPQVRDDHSLVYVGEEPGTSDGRHDDLIDLTVTLVRPDGSSLSVLETNSASTKDAAAPGAPLLLSSEQITAMLDSPVWDAAIAAADAVRPPVDRTNPARTPSGGLETQIVPEGTSASGTGSGISTSASDTSSGISSSSSADTSTSTSTTSTR